MARCSLIVSGVCYVLHPVITNTPPSHPAVARSARKSFSLEKFRINKRKRKSFPSAHFHPRTYVLERRVGRSIGRTGKLLWDIIFHRYDYVCRSLTPREMCSGNLSDYLIKRASAFALPIELLSRYHVHNDIGAT